MDPALDSLHTLAEARGIQLSYYDVTGRLCQATPDALVRVLQILGTQISSPDQAAEALRIHHQAEAKRLVEPVVLSWDGHSPDLNLRLPSNSTGAISCRVVMEDGQPMTWSCPLDTLPIANQIEVEGISYSSRRLTLPGTLPLGYHQFEVEVAGQTAKSLLLAAPERAYQPPNHAAGNWGVFAPLYAIHSEKSWGSGDFGDLERFADWTKELGGGLIATLPLLAAFLDEPFEPGPYSPASRLFWNEFYLDVERIPELARCPKAKAILSSTSFAKEKEELRALPSVDYRRLMKLKRQVLEELVKVFFAEPSSRFEAFKCYLAAHPRLDDYACFRATMDRRQESWTVWPERLRDGTLRDGDFDENARRYHQYVQWLADEQLHSIAAKAREMGPGFYLDLPLGVNPDSYDVWREKDAFANGVAAGAPPDPFFATGQNWGFAPLHPERIRSQGYRYVRSYIQHHLGLAGVLRIDHMMGLHRLFWIPKGMHARDGIYVKYHADEYYAVFTLESHRHKSMLVGEDLGTVPPEVPPAMARHNVHRMYVLQYSLQPWADNAVQPVFEGCVASANTHDMPPFAAFWRGLDIEDRIDLGILTRDSAGEEHRQRQALLGSLVQYLRNHGRLGHEFNEIDVLRACLIHMCSGQAFVVLATLEDLWGETLPQNVPGTWKERNNWRRKATHSLEEIRQMPQVVDTLRAMNQHLRSHGR
jgi:4-alpha-glucanotransferase